MNRIRSAAALLALCGGTAFAQSNVTLYGNIDAGVMYVNNVKGSSLFAAQEGNLVPNFWGLRGSEDLGGGNRAIFNLQGGFSVLSGNMIRSGVMFNRQAFVGLASQSAGTLTLGHQTTFNFDILAPFSTGFNLGSFYAMHPGNFDELANTFQYDNSVKYRTPSVGGLTAGAMYGFSNQAGAFAQGRNYAFALDYANGPFKIGATYESENNRTLNLGGGLGLSSYQGVNLASGATFPTDNVRNYGVGMSYRIERWLLHALFTATRIQAGGSAQTMTNYDVGANFQWTLTNAINAGVAHSRFNGQRWTQFSVADVYSLSKRTSLYVNVLYQMASGNGAVAVLQGIGGPSSTNRQFAVVTGMQHTF